MMLWNYTKTAILLGLLAGLMLAAGQALGGTQGLTIALVFVILTNGLMFFFSHKLVLMMYGAKPAKKADYPRLHAMVEQIAKRAGIPKPKVYIIPTPHANAFATGRSPKHAVVACTEGIMSLLSENELEGVIAHEIAHIKNRDMLITTIAAVMASAISYLATMARWAAIFGGMNPRDERDGNHVMTLVVLTFLTPIIAMLLQLAISRSREYAADASGARYLKDSKGLAHALKKLAQGPKLSTSSNATQATASLFIVHPFTGEGFLHMFMTHPPMGERIKRLEAMKF